MTGSTAVWAGFILLVLALLAIDLGVFHRKSHTVGSREALLWTLVWVSLAVLFAAGIWTFEGHQKAIDFITGYVVEYSLSVDNIFVFVLILSHFSVPPKDQHRVLFWGIVGAIVMRGAMIAAGIGLLHKFEWLVYVFGAFLLWTGFRIAFKEEKEFEPEKSPFVRAARKFISITDGFRGNAFFVRKDGRLLATPLFLVLLVIEVSDVIFAVDSIPAVFAVTRDPFIVYTSNIFAILGLRSLYFLVSGAMGGLRYLKPSLAAILIFVGLKMCSEELIKIPALISLGIIVGILAIGILASVVAARRESRR